MSLSRIGKYWILDDERQLVETDMMTWARWFETAERHVALTETQLFRISTVFLGFDQSFSERGPPILFETMVFERQPHLRRWFDGTLRESFEDLEQLRYSSWDDAELNHWIIVRRYLKLEAESGPQIRKIKSKKTEQEQEVNQPIEEN